MEKTHPRGPANTRSCSGYPPQPGTGGQNTTLRNWDILRASGHVVIERVLSHAVITGAHMFASSSIALPHPGCHASLLTSEQGHEYSTAAKNRDDFPIDPSIPVNNTKRPLVKATSRFDGTYVCKQRGSLYLAPAYNVRIHCEQVHNFSFALVPPLSSEHHGHFVLGFLRHTERRLRRDAPPRPLHHRLSVQGHVSSVDVRHGAVGCHAAALFLQTGISFYRVSS